MAHWTHDTVVDAPPQVVFDVLADKENWNRIVPIPTSLVQPGASVRQGVGAIHKLGIGPLGADEQVLIYEPAKRYEYKIVSRAPIRHHRGVITFEKVGDGTRVRYRMELVPLLPVPAPLVAAGIRTALTLLLRGVKREVARRA